MQHQATCNREAVGSAPAPGGFCADALWRDHAAPVEIDAWQIPSGRLLLNYNQGNRGMFDADRPAHARKAGSDRPDLAEKQGR